MARILSLWFAGNTFVTDVVVVCATHYHYIRNEHAILNSTHTVWSLILRNLGQLPSLTASVTEPCHCVSAVPNLSLVS